MSEQCVRCGVPGQDRRTIWLACFYDMGWMGLRSKEIAIHGSVAERDGDRAAFGQRVYRAPDERDDIIYRFDTLRVCKRCRAEWMCALKAWFESKPSIDDPCAGTYEPTPLEELHAELDAKRCDVIELLSRIDATRAELYALERGAP